MELTAPRSLLVLGHAAAHLGHPQLRHPDAATDPSIATVATRPGRSLIFHLALVVVDRHRLERARHGEGEAPPSVAPVSEHLAALQCTWSLHTSPSARTVVPSTPVIARGPVRPFTPRVVAPSSDTSTGGQSAPSARELRTVQSVPHVAPPPPTYVGAENVTMYEKQKYYC